MSERIGNKMVINVGSDTVVKSLAGCIKANYDKIKPDGEPEIILRYIGSGAGNQAIKAIIIANRWLSSTGMVIHIIPNFSKSIDSSRGNNQDMVAIEFNLKFLRI